ncbi:MAG: orotate phosphoribosyltransferase [Betaproteobacteria bacterium]|nr:orotate phosphoribosyltransferase [Betaproteobacteria bacterium]
MTAPLDFQQEFVAFAIRQGVLRFGEFTTKAGRQSPYFFNTGLFNDGQSLRLLSSYYAAAIEASGVPFDMLFGPAYKGIVLAAITALALAERGRNLPYAYNRKEAKDHGEGGITVGAPLAGRVLIVDDVISAGTSVRESVEIIRGAGAVPAGVVIALDRQERGLGALSAAQEVSETHGIPVIAVATLDNVVTFLGSQIGHAEYVEKIQSYRRRYGIGALL